MNYQFEENVTKLPKGKYVIIDPCYVFGDDTKFWDDFVGFSFPKAMNGRGRGPFTVETNGKKWVTWSTRYGDGVYPVSQDMVVMGKAGVDAGCLAIVPEELVEDTEMGVAVTVNHDTVPDIKEGDAEIDNVYVCTCGGHGEDVPYIDEDEQEE
jgi:hypothetical protein